MEHFYNFYQKNLRTLKNRVKKSKNSAKLLKNSFYTPKIFAYPPYCISSCHGPPSNRILCTTSLTRSSSSLFLQRSRISFQYRTPTKQPSLYPVPLPPNPLIVRISPSFSANNTRRQRTGLLYSSFPIYSSSSTATSSSSA